MYVSIAIASLLIWSCSQPPQDQLFTKVSSRSTGIDFKNTLRETDEFNVLKYGYFYNGGGVAIGDINNDGLADIYLTANMKASHLYLNKGEWKFDEIAEQAGVEAAGLWNTGVTMADVNNDGWLDIYVCRSAANLEIRRKNLLFINNKDLTFTESAAAYGLDDGGYSTQAAFFDYDKDGDLDMFLLNHSIQDYAGFSQMLPTFKNRKSNIYGDRLYRNDLIPTEDGSFGRFLNMTAQSGILTNVLGFGLGVAIEDLNQDGWLDIYVSNDYNEEDYCYINQQDGTFKESVREYFNHTSLFSMGSDIADINNDGLPEVYTLDMLPEDNYRQKMATGADNFDKKQVLYNSGFHNQSMRNMLHLNNGDGSYSEIGQFSGVSNTDWSWAAFFADFDLDGWKDLFVSNGYKSDYTNMSFMSYATDMVSASDEDPTNSIPQLLAKIPSIHVPNYIYKNNRDLTFTNMTKEWGLGEVTLSNGASYGDLDNDGDLDLIVNNINEPLAVFKNNADKLENRNYLRLKFANCPLNRLGFGTSVVLKSDGTVQHQTLIPTRGFQSSVEPVLTFGLGESTTVEEINISWPNGEETLITNVSANQVLTIEYDTVNSNTSPSNIESTALFSTNIEDNLGIEYRHREKGFNDFKREPLLPHMLSTQGPQMSVGDLNKDGLDDLYIGGSTGVAGGVWIQQSNGIFIPKEQDAFESDKNSEDLGSILFDADNDGDLDLYVTSGSNEAPEGSAEYLDRLYINDSRGKFSKAEDHLPDISTSNSSVTAGDVDNDGDLDLFVGGRLVPGKYPYSPGSHILINDGQGKFSNQTEEVGNSLQEVGMVTDAQFVHLNNDEYIDLITIGEWEPIRFYFNENGKLIEGGTITDKESGNPSNATGWWNKLASADIDGDGDMDFILGNFGQNSQIQASETKPVNIIAKDFDNNGSIDPIVSYYVGDDFSPMAPRDDLIGQLVTLKKRFQSYEDYAKVSTNDLFSQDELDGAISLNVNILHTSYLENKGDGSFLISSLPSPAQWSPTYGIMVHDFNSDGHLDVLLGGNFADTRVQFGKYDASKGTLLYGDGSGGFDPATNRKVGLLVQGYVRDIELLKLSSGKEAIAIAKNNEEIQIIEINQTADE